MTTYTARLVRSGTLPERVGRVPVQMDYLMGVQAIAALEQRLDILEAHALRIHAVGAQVEPVLSNAIVETIAAMFAIRAAFNLDEGALDDEHERLHRELDELKREGEREDIPLALDSYWNRGA